MPIIISGGFTKNNAPSEASLAKDYFKLDNVILEESSLNTYQSALNLKKYCLNQKGKILLITDSYHSLRSYLAFKSQNCKVVLYNHKINTNIYDFKPSIYGYSKINKVIYEYIGLLYYLVSNKINIFNI